MRLQIIVMSCNCEWSEVHGYNHILTCAETVDREVHGYNHILSPEMEQYLTYAHNILLTKTTKRKHLFKYLTNLYT